MTEKPFKGVIRQWYRDGDVICGICEYHKDSEALSASAMLRNAVVPDYGVHTSRVENIEDRGSFSICETKNSIYILIDARL